MTNAKKEDKDVQSQEKPINLDAKPGGPLAEFFDREENFGKMELRPKQRPGRPWTLEELRLKSNTDLHKLWYLCYFSFSLVSYTDLLQVRLLKGKKHATNYGTCP